VNDKQTTQGISVVEAYHYIDKIIGTHSTLSGLTTELYLKHFMEREDLLHDLITSLIKKNLAEINKAYVQKHCYFELMNMKRKYSMKRYITRDKLDSYSEEPIKENPDGYRV